jgi:hypothetical protein
VQLLKNFPAFYETRSFITVFTRDFCWSLSWPTSIQSIPHYPITLRSILILSTHLRLGLPSGSFPPRFPTNILYAFLFSHLCYMPCLSHPPWLDYSNSNCIWRRVRVMKLLIMEFPPTSCHFISLRTKIPLSTLFSNTLSLCSSLNVRDQVSHSNRTTGKIIFFYTLIFTCLDSRLEDKRFWSQR